MASREERKKVGRKGMKVKGRRDFRNTETNIEQD